MERRTFIKALSVACASVLLLPKTIMAAVWNKAAFVETKFDKTLQNLGMTHAKPSDRIVIKAPDRAENGAIVQVEVKSELANTQAITLLVEKNPTPLIATYAFSEGAVGGVTTRIKMADTSDVTVIVKAGDQYYRNQKNVVVLESGCG